MRYFQTNDFLLLRSYNFLHNARSSFGAIAPRTSFRCLARENAQRRHAGVLRFVKHRPTSFRPTTENVPRLFSGSSPFSIKTPLVFLRRRHTASRPFTTCGQRARTHARQQLFDFCLHLFTPRAQFTHSQRIKCEDFCVFAFTAFRGFTPLPWSADWSKRSRRERSEGKGEGLRSTLLHPQQAESQLLTKPINSMIQIKSIHT